MRKRILWVSLLITIVGLLVYSFVSTEIYYANSVDYGKGHLVVFMNFYDRELYPPDKTGAEEFSRALDGARVTFMSLDGSVLADSNADDVTQNHSDREEVVAAITDGQGFAVRRSRTLGENTIYFCRRFDDLLVRISISAASQWAVFADAVPTLIWFAIADVAVCLLFTWLATGFFLKPVERLTEQAAKTGNTDIKTRYAELKPLADIMSDMNRRIDEKINKIDSDRKLENLILDNMEHGIVIFRDKSDIVLINRTATKLLDYYEGENYIVLFYNDEEVSEVIAGRENALLYRMFGGRDYALRFNPTEEANVLLITDVTEIKRAERSKNDFIANVTHEMNTPLTSISGFAELIKNGLPPEKCAKSADIIIEQSRRLSDLIKSIINFSALDNDELPDYEINFSLLLSEALDSFAPAIAEKNITLSKDIAPDVKIMSRSERLTEVVNNLVSNAIRYNRQNGSIFVMLTQEKLLVSDTGIGISEENLPRVFDRFYTVDTSHGGKGGGFGLGLAIVKKLCRRAGWRLGVESRLGEGTSFEIDFSSAYEKEH